MFTSTNKWYKNGGQTITMQICLNKQNNQCNIWAFLDVDLNTSIAKRQL